MSVAKTVQESGHERGVQRLDISLHNLSVSHSTINREVLELIRTEFRQDHIIFLQTAPLRITNSTPKFGLLGHDSLIWFARTEIST